MPTWTAQGSRARRLCSPTPRRAPRLPWALTKQARGEPPCCGRAASMLVSNVAPRGGFQTTRRPAASFGAGRARAPCQGRGGKCVAKNAAAQHLGDAALRCRPRGSKLAPRLSATP
eukprot:13811033-Alexandrium_andersonii.AAC.1